MCENTGYRGRFAIHEVLLCDQEIKMMIHQKMPIDNIQSLAISKGMLTLKANCIEAIKRGDTTVSEMMRLGLL